MLRVQYCAIVAAVALVGQIAVCEADETSHSITAKTTSRRIVEDARRILADVKETTYTHKSVIDEKQGIYDTDCSGFVDLVLGHVAPQALQAVEKLRTHKRQLAEDYYETFKSAPALAAKQDTAGGWVNVERVSDARAGDILCWKNPNHVTGEHTDTGHVMIIDEKPVEETEHPEGHRLYRIVVIDSAASRHADDTRPKGASGIGRGTLFLDVDAEGHPTAFHWSSPSRAGHAGPIAIGRVHRDSK